MKEETFREIFMSLPLACLVLKPLKTGFFVKNANKAFCEAVSRRNKDIMGAKIKNAFQHDLESSEANYNILSQSLKKVIRTTKKTKTGVLRYDLWISGKKTFSERYWTIENIPVFDNEGQVVYILCCFKETPPPVVTTISQKKLLVEEIETA